MAETKRGNINENLRSVIQDLASIIKAEVNSTRALHAVEPTNLPYVNITPTDGEYIQEQSGVGSVEVWHHKVTVTIITKDGNIEDLRGDIKEVIALDITRGGHAENTIYTGDKIVIDADIPAGIQAMEMEITCVYITEGGKKI